MAATGGEPTRLTFNSARDIPYDFTPDDQHVVFGTDRHDIFSSARFPGDAYWAKLFSVPVKGGASIMINSAGTEFVRFNEKGDKFIYQDRKGYEDPWRKHHTSAVTPATSGSAIPTRTSTPNSPISKAKTANRSGEKAISSIISANATATRTSTAPPSQTPPPFSRSPISKRIPSASSPAAPTASSPSPMTATSTRCRKKKAIPPKSSRSPSTPISAAARPPSSP